MFNEVRNIDISKVSVSAGRGIVFSVNTNLVLWLALFLIVGLLFASLSLQVQAGAESLVRAELNSISSKSLSSPRGLFYDRNHNRLVVNQSNYSLVVEVSELSPQNHQEIADKALKVLDVPVEDLLEILSQEQVAEVVIAEGLDNDQAIRLYDALREYPVRLVELPVRNYLMPEQFAHVLGYTGIVSQADLESDYEITDRLGKSGLELVMEDQLKGVKGKQVSLGGVNEVIAGIPGNNVFLTIDSEWQSKLYSLLRDQVNTVGAESGAAAIVDIDTGDLYAYVSVPSYDPNQFVTGISSELFQQYQQNSGLPLVDKMAGLQAPPGSTFKLVSAFVGLETGFITTDTRVYSTGCMPLGDREFCEFGKYYLGELDIVRALSRSSNTFFCDSTLRLASKEGFQAYYDFATNLGIGSRTGIELPGELAGIMPSPDYKLNNYSEKWFGGDTCNTSIGQGMVLTTPLQMMMMTAAIANGGKVYQPNLVVEVQNQSGQLVQATEPKVTEQVSMDPQTRQLILSGMEQAVQSSEGTAYRVLNQTPGQVRAKTGSAEAIEYENGVLQSKVHGWVVGTFEHSGSTFAYVVHVHQGGGGWNATPVVRDFLTCLHSGFGNGC